MVRPGRTTWRGAMRVDANGLIGCKFCRRRFLRTRPDANRQNYCSVECRLLSGRRIAPSGCWEWSRATFGQTGYGVIRMSGRTRTVHRAAYEALCGPIPNGMQVLHRCDNRRCFNPEHLFIGTPKDNAIDMVNKGRHRCQRAAQVGSRAVRLADMMEVG